MADFPAWIEKNKALWTRVYDEVIAPDFEEEWKKREEKHVKELKEKEENQQILFGHISNEVVQNAHLAVLIEQLKMQLHKQNGVTAQPIGEETANTREATISEGEFRRLIDKYNELSKKYQDVSQKVKYLERKNNAVMQKNKDMKDSVRAWQVYADRQSGKQKLKVEARADDVQPKISAVHHLLDDRPRIPSSPTSIATVRTPESLADLDRSSPANIVPLPLPITGAVRQSSSLKTDRYDEDRSTSASLTPKPQGQAGAAEQHRLDSANSANIAQNSPSRDVAPIFKQMHNIPALLQSANPSSSQTTEDEVAEQMTRSTQATGISEDEDIPQFVSERSLKRKRRQPSKFQIYAHQSSDGTPVKPYRVKEEQYSSPPSIMHTLFRKETIDLDDPAPDVLQTPRHPKRTSSIPSNSTGTLRHQKSNSAPFTQGIENKNTLPVADVEDLQAGLDNPRVTLVEVRAISEPSDPTRTEEAVLRTLDPNVLASTSEGPPTKRLKQAESRQAEKHRILAESGEEPPPTDNDELRLPPHLARAQFNRRFQAAKDLSSPTKSLQQTPNPVNTRIKLEHDPLLPSSASRSIRTPIGGAGLSKSLPKARSKPRGDPTLDDRPIWTMQAPETRPSARKAPKSKSPARVARLRDTSITELSVQDFKPNPAYNQGYSYAFSETVRKRGDRMCLPGCTNPQCCGSTFRTFAEVQAALPASQEEALLEDYLGDAYSNMQLTKMSSEERSELVLQARTKKMAKEAGKHREAYERRSTPPGFWRVDFPTTQEQQEDRERAREREKKVVQERWLEAQRRGGRWIFRDE